MVAFGIVCGAGLAFVKYQGSGGSGSFGSMLAPLMGGRNSGFVPQGRGTSARQMFDSPFGSKYSAEIQQQQPGAASL
jgi:hypothetical protein